MADENWAPDGGPSLQEMNALVELFSEARYVDVESLTRGWTIRFPQNGIVWKALGTALTLQGRSADALAPMQKAAAFLPGDAETHFNLGVIYGGLGQMGDEEASYRRALQINPDYAAVHNNLGTCLKDLGRMEEALESYRRALQTASDWAEVHNNLGITLKGLDRLIEAEASFRRAIQIKPDYAEAHSNLGAVFRDLGAIAEAEASFRRALQIRPDYAAAHCNLGAILKDSGRLEAAEASFRRALQIRPDYTEAHSNLLFSLNYLESRSSASCLEDALEYDRRVMDKACDRFSSWLCLPRPDRLKVGIVSGDLRQHPVGSFLESLLAQVDRAQVELVAFPTHAKTDELTAHIRPHFAAWKPLFGQSDEAAARCIHAQGVHILLDLSGHTGHNRLPVFAWKPAPVQATWLGYLATTGMKDMDYLIADSWTLPAGEETNFVEKIWRLPDSYICFTPPNVWIPVSQLPALVAGFVTFGSLNNLTKVSDSVVALWARVLASVPRSRLYLKTKQLQESSIRQDLVARFAAHGIEAARLILEGPVQDRAGHLASYRQIDIALDPFPYPGITTSVESLWMGVPVLTLAGKSFLSRQGVGLLMNTGLPEWIAADADEYLARAVSHAGDLQRLAALRSGLRQQVLASPLFDAPRFARHFEAALRGMWSRWCDRQQEQPS